MSNLKKILAKLPFWEPIHLAFEKFLFSKGNHEKIQKFLLRLHPNKNASTLKDPIFIVGCPHSGTSLMLAILDSHPNIHGIGYESYLFFKRSFLKIPTFNKWNRETLKAKKNRWVEKTPEHISKINKILGYYPNGKVLLLIRDGRDVAWSIKKRIGDFSEGINWWIRWNDSGKPYWDNSNVLVIKYENLVGETESTLKSIFSFLNESFDERVLDYNKKERSWFYKDGKPEKNEPSRDNQGAFRNWQINQPIFDGRGRWIKNLSAEEIEYFSAKAGEKMFEFGYNLEK